MRKIIQIVATSSAFANDIKTLSNDVIEYVGLGNRNNVIYALCDDGTVWWMNPLEDNVNWCKLGDIPQD